VAVHGIVWLIAVTFGKDEPCLNTDARHVFRV